MKSSDKPTSHPVVFATNGYREPILEKTPISDNTASYDEGFPSVTMQPIAAGGKPPKGRNVNQILYELSALTRWYSAGMPAQYDAEFQKAIGGYPKGAIVADETGVLYQSLVDNNTAPLSDNTKWIFFTEGRYLPVNTQIFYIGEFRNFPFRKNKLPKGWYPRDGKLYDLTSAVGKVLNSLDDDFKEDWIIKVNNGKINMPSAFEKNGWGIFERPVDGDKRQVGSFQDDAIRNITGWNYGSTDWANINKSTGGAFYSSNRNTAMFSAKDRANRAVEFDASRVVPTADENRPKNIGMTPAIYLGV